MVNAELTPRTPADSFGSATQPKAQVALAGSAHFWRFWPLVVLSIAAAALAALSIGAGGRDYSFADLQITNWLQDLRFPGLHSVLSFSSFLTSAQVGIVTWLVLVIALGLNGRPLEALMVFSVSAMWVGDNFLGMLVDRPRPSPELISMTQTASGQGFPSGHTSGAVLFYGLIILLAGVHIRSALHRIGIQALAGSIIALAAVSRVYLGAHWPSDVLGSLLLGGLALAAFGWVYNSIRQGRLPIPMPSHREIPPSTNNVRVAHSIASTVHLDPVAGTATKEYNPPRLVRAIYWAAFQAPFPYQHRREALETATAIRKIAGLLTDHRYGYDLVAPVVGIENGEGSYRFVTEFVPGSSPESNGEVEDTLADLFEYFQEVGLPTWQIAPGNPHAYSNFIRNPEGELKLIDLESALISTPPWKQLRAFVRDGHFPAFDDVDFVRLRSYVEDHALELTQSLGRWGFEDLKQAIAGAELSTQVWKESEPRIWGRLARRIYRFLDMSKFTRSIQGHLSDSEAAANAFVGGAIERWEREGRIDSKQAAQLQRTMSTSETRTLLKHLGAHLVLSVALAVPIPGLRSFARFGWTLAFRLDALYSLIRGRITREEYRVARSIHSIPVMLLALIPAFGAIAYVVSDTMVKNGLGRMLFDQPAYNLPFGLYRRLGLARFTAPRLPQSAVRPRGDGISSHDAVPATIPVRVDR